MSLEEKIHNLLDDHYSFVVDGPEYLEYQSDQSFNPASTIKMHILYAALKAMESGKMTKDTMCTIADEEIVPGCGVIQQLTQRTYSIHDILTLMIIYSDNTATNFMIDYLTLDYIKEVLEALGCTQTHIRRKLYHVVPGVFNESCTRDLNIVLHAFYEGIGIHEASSQYALSILKKQQLQNIAAPLRLCGKCQDILKGNTCHCGTFKGDVDPIVVTTYSKSGEISGHVHDACIIEINDHPIYVSVLTSQQKDNLVTREQLGKVGLIVYDHFKEALCLETVNSSST